MSAVAAEEERQELVDEVVVVEVGTLVVVVDDVVEEHDAAVASSAMTAKAEEATDLLVGLGGADGILNSFAIQCRVKLFQATFLLTREKETGGKKAEVAVL